MKAAAQPWILSARFDSAFILAPGIFTALIALLFYRQFEAVGDMPSWLWLILVVGVDAGHVYTTLFRTYLVKEEWHKRQALLTLIPLSAWLAGSLLYSIDSLLFWRALAYLAIFHFVRQQYGFMMIYGRNETAIPNRIEAGGFGVFVNLYGKSIDKAAIYLATIYPLVYWHCQGRHFDWFIADDILLLTPPWLSHIIFAVYLFIISLYFIKEYFQYKLTKSVNLPKNLMLIATALSWYVGIIAFDNDLIFTATNIIAHGIPYYALIWAYAYKQTLTQKHRPVYRLNWLKHLFNRKAAVLYIGLMFGLAFTEEGLWDGLIWQDHRELFSAFAWLPKIQSPENLGWLVPLLALPQATHYLLDAYIWRLQQPDTEWKAILFHPIVSPR